MFRISVFNICREKSFRIKKKKKTIILRVFYSFFFNCILSDFSAFRGFLSTTQLYLRLNLIYYDFSSFYHDQPNDYLLFAVFTLNLLFWSSCSHFSYKTWRFNHQRRKKTLFLIIKSYYLVKVEIKRKFF